MESAHQSAITGLHVQTKPTVRNPPQLVAVNKCKLAAAVQWRLALAVLHVLAFSRSPRLGRHKRDFVRGSSVADVNAQMGARLRPCSPSTVASGLVREDLEQRHMAESEPSQRLLNRATCDRCHKAALDLKR